MLESELREDLFNANSADHRKLLSSSGLRVASSSERRTGAGRYDPPPGTSKLHRIAPDSLFTPVSPMGHNHFVNETIFPQYWSVNAMAALLPIAVEQPNNGLDLVLRCLPYIDVKGLLCGEKQEVDGKVRVRTFLKGSLLPREVGGFQDAFRAAVERVFGPKLKHVHQKKEGGTVDLLFDVGKERCAVEMLVDNVGTQLADHIEKHHIRWMCRDKHHANYAKNKERGVTVAFVRDIESSQLTKFCRGSLSNSSVPLLLVGFEHGAYAWKCRLLYHGQRTDFTLDVDGVAMKLTENGALKPAQRIAVNDKCIKEVFSACDKGEGKRNVHCVLEKGGTTREDTVSVESPWTVDKLLSALDVWNHSSAIVRGPNRFNHVVPLQRDDELPATSLSCPIVVTVSRRNIDKRRRRQKGPGLS